ncbi:MAG: TolC family protein [Deltaproteobacteria bacterium]|nr:MAG: TolC family protein [Deltaproteobacteria bacterium]
MVRPGRNLGSGYAAIQRVGALLFCVAVALVPKHSAAQPGEPLLTLQQSIGIALDRNLELKVAQEEVDVAWEQQREARTNFLPKFSLEYGYTRPSETTIMFSGVTFVNKDQHQWALNGHIDQPLFTGFANLSIYQLAKLDLDVAKIQLARTRLDIILQVKEAYYEILSAQKLLEVARQSVRQLQEGVRVAENFYRVGMRPKVNVLDAEVRLARAVQETIVAENDLGVAKAILNTILHRPITSPFSVEDILSTEPYEKTFESSREIALKSRPEVLEAEKRVMGAQKEITLAKSDYYPTIKWSLNYYRRGDDPTVDGSQFTDREFWEAGAMATWTFFEWGKTRYATNQKRGRLRQAEETLVQVKDAVNLEVKTAFLTVQAAEKAVNVAKKAIESAEENFRISGERYKEQVATATEVLDAQTRLTQARTDYTTALVAFNLARARLIRAMGLEREP